MVKVSELISTLVEREFTGDARELDGRVFLLGKATDCMMLRKVYITDGKLQDEFVCGVDIIEEVNGRQLAISGYGNRFGHNIPMLVNEIIDYMRKDRCVNGLFFYITDDPVNYDEYDNLIPNREIPVVHPPMWRWSAPDLFFKTESIEYDVERGYRIVEPVVKH